MPPGWHYITYAEDHTVPGRTINDQHILPLLLFLILYSWYSCLPVSGLCSLKFRYQSQVDIRKRSGRLWHREHHRALPASKMASKASTASVLPDPVGKCSLWSILLEYQDLLLPFLSELFLKLKDARWIFWECFVCKKLYQVLYTVFCLHRSPRQQALTEPFLGRLLVRPFNVLKVVTLNYILFFFNFLCIPDFIRIDRSKLIRN